MAAARWTLILVAISAAVGDRSPELWKSLYQTAQARLNVADFESARQAASRGYDHWRSKPAALWHWPFRLALAEALLELDRIPEAQPLLEGSAGGAGLEGRRQIDLAYAAARLHNYEEATRRLDHLQARGLTTSREAVGKVALIRGMVHLKQERYPQAEASFRRALQAVENTGTLVETYAVIDLGYLDLVQFRYDEAVAWFERARRVAERSGATRAHALALGNLGVCNYWLGDYDRSLQLLSSAVAIAAKDRDRVYQQRWLVVLAEVHDAMRQYSKAVQYLEQARSLAQSGVDDDWLVHILDNLAEISLATGDLAAAERLNQEAFSIAARLSGNDPLVRPRLNAARLAAARKEFPDSEKAFRLAISTSRHASDPMSLWEGHAGLAGLYRQTGRLDQAGTEYRAAIAAIERERSKLRADQWKFSFFSHLISFYQEYVDFLVDRGEVEQAFEVAESCRARVLAEKLRAASSLDSAARVERLERSVRDSGAVLFSYWLAPRRSLLWVIDAGGLHLSILPPQQRIAEAVALHNRGIMRGRRVLEAEQAAGQWLYRELVPAQYPVPRGSRLIISPDDCLHQLNFETLPAGEPEHYWIEDVTMAVAPSLDLSPAPRDPAAPRLLLIGDPDFRGSGLANLPSLKAEVENVSRHFPAKDVYTRAAATPRLWRDIHPARYSVVHFAAHGIANREDPLDSAIILSPRDGVYKLYARDVMAQPLRAGLVTLSACQTAGSRAYSGEGLTGFAWAFLSAGARNVVAGLWDVDDRATAELMGRFYQALAAGSLPAAALRHAKLSLISDGGLYRKPVYWAAFQNFTRSLDPPVTLISRR